MAKGIIATREGSRVTFTIDFDADHGPTKGEKGVVVASTGGFIPIIEKDTGKELGKLNVHAYKVVKEMKRRESFNL